MSQHSNIAKVKGHESLVRDMSSNAIIATDDAEYEAYKRRKETIKKQHQMIKDQNIEIQSLKSDMQEIKNMLAQLIRGN
jgi:Tfp pilus assembly protein PilO